MAVTDPVLAALDQAEADGVDPSAPVALGPHELAPPTVEVDPTLPPVDPELKSGGGAGMSGAAEPEVEVEPEVAPEDEASEPEPEIAPVGEAEGEESDRPLDEPPSAPSLDAAYEQAFGHKPDVDTSAALLSLYRDLSSASPERVAQARAILAGYEQQTQQAAEPVQTAPVPELVEVQIPEFVDDDTRRVMEAQNANIRAVAEMVRTQGEQTHQAQVEYQRQQLEADTRRQVTAAESARDRFVKDHPGLTETDLSVLQEAAARNPMYGVFVQTHAGDYEKAAYDTFRHTLVDQPQISEKLAAAQVAAEAERRKVDTTRKAKAGKVSGAAAAPPTPRAASKEERMAGLKQAIADGALG